jgi:hypothetical protein
MFRIDRAIPAGLVLVLGLSLSACGSSNFDPTDWISGDLFGSKPKLPGERKPVFPGGVPGVPEGVPSELVKGNQPAADTPAVITAEQPAPTAKPAQPARPQATRPPAKPQTASAPPPQAAPPRTAAPRPAQSAAPAPNWPEPSAQANWPPPDPNTFSR